MAKKIRVMIADDSVYLCEYFSLMLNSTEVCECVATANNEAETLEACLTEKPDVLLLDIQMDYMDSGLKLIPKLKKLFPELKIIIISVHDEKDLVFEAVRLGAYDYIIKNQPADEIVESIKNAYEDKKIMRKDIAQLILEEYKEIERRQASLLYMFNKLLCLSEREIKILRSLCNGKKYHEIAQENVVEEVTVRSQINRILKKLDYKNIGLLVKHLNEIKIFELFDKKEKM